MTFHTVQRKTFNSADVVILRNKRGAAGRIDEAGYSLRNMTCLGVYGLDPRRDFVSLVRTMPSYEESVRFIGDCEKKSWGNARFGAVVWPHQNRLQATHHIGGRGELLVDGRRLPIPVDEKGIVLHSLGLRTFVPWTVVKTEEDPDNWEYASFTAATVLPNWFSTINALRSVSLAEGVLTESSTYTNIGRRRTYVSDTVHHYFEFPEGQPREDVLVQLNASKVLNTVTPPFVEGETLLPVFPDPFSPVAKSPLASLFTGQRQLGPNFLDHFFGGLDAEITHQNTLQHAARAFYPKFGWGVEISTPLDNGFPVMGGVQCYSPSAKANPDSDGRIICFEHSPAATDPFNDGWKDSPIFPGRADRNPGGMIILNPTESVTLTRRIRMITEMSKG